jgi:hypothetical protein
MRATRVLLVVIVVLIFGAGFFAGKLRTNRWFAQHKTCFSNEPIKFEAATFSAAPMTGMATEVTLNNGETVVSIDYDGKVHFGKGMTQDKASRAFWQKMGRDIKKCRQEERRGHAREQVR